MTEDQTIVEVPQPPPGHLPFLLLLARTVGNPVASWGRDLYREPAVHYRSLGLQTLFLLDPALIQTVLLDEAETYSKSPIHDDILGEGGGQGLLIADGEHWRWQRRVLAPLFRAEEVGAYVPALRAAAREMVRGGAERAASHRRRHSVSDLAGARGHRARRRAFR